MYSKWLLTRPYKICLAICLLNSFKYLRAYHHFNSLLIRSQPCHAMCNLLNSDSADEKLSTKKLTLYGRKFYICQTFVWSLGGGFVLRPGWEEWENKMFYQLKITSEPSICNGVFGWVSAEHFERLFTFHWPGDRLWELSRSSTTSPTTTSGGWPATSPPPAPPPPRRRKRTAGSGRGGTWRSSRCST